MRSLQPPIKNKKNQFFYITIQKRTKSVHGFYRVSIYNTQSVEFVFVLFSGTRRVYVMNWTQNKNRLIFQGYARRVLVKHAVQTRTQRFLQRNESWPVFITVTLSADSFGKKLLIAHQLINFEIDVWKSDESKPKRVIRISINNWLPCFFFSSLVGLRNLE